MLEVLLGIKIMKWGKSERWFIEMIKLIHGHSQVLEITGFQKTSPFAWGHIALSGQLKIMQFQHLPVQLIALLMNMGSKK